MEAPETPLVLLSHAAAFVNRDVINRVGNYEDQNVASSKSVVKSQKLKRSNDRGSMLFTGPVKVKRPLELPSSTMTEAEVMEVDGTQQEGRSSPRQTKVAPSPYGNRLRDPCHCAENPSDDKPLDMSKKCGVVEQHRPSVITCAPTLLRKAQENKSIGEVPHLVRGSKIEKVTTRRREVVSGMCDPVIDEHFRRSLGKDYPQIFSAPAAATSVSITVDDHFAKALGETWQRLQENPSSASTSSTSHVKETDKSAKLNSPASAVQQGLVTL